MSQALARRYAEAAFSAAIDSKEVAKLLESSRLVSTLCKEMPSVLKILSDERVSRENREKAVVAIADSLGVCASMKGLLQVCVIKSRTKLVPLILKELISKICAAEGLAQVTAKVADVSLKDEFKKRIEESLSKELGINVECKVSEERSLIGGFIVNLGSKTLDASVRGKLLKMKATLAKSFGNAR